MTRGPANVWRLDNGGEVIGVTLSCSLGLDEVLGCLSEKHNVSNEGDCRWQPGRHGAAHGGNPGSRNVCAKILASPVGNSELPSPNPGLQQCVQNKISD